MTSAPPPSIRVYVGVSPDLGVRLSTMSLERAIAARRVAILYDSHDHAEGWRKAHDAGERILPATLCVEGDER